MGNLTLGGDAGASPLTTVVEVVGAFRNVVATTTTTITIITIITTTDISNSSPRHK